MKPQNKSKPSKLSTIWFFISHHRLEFMIIVSFGLFASMLESLNVALMYPMINNALDLQTGSNPIFTILDPFIRLIPVNDELIRYASAFILVAITSFVLKSLYLYSSARLSAKIVKQVKKNLFEKYKNADYQFFIDNKQGEIQYKISIAPVRLSAMLQVLTEIFLSVFLAFSVFIILFMMSWKLLLIVILFGIIYFYAIRQISTRISYKTGKNQRDSWQKEQVLVTEYTSGIKQIKVFGTFDYWKNIFNKTIDSYWHHNRKNHFWNSFPNLILWMLLYSSIGGAIIAIKILYPGQFLELIPFVGTFAIGVFLVLPKIASFGSYITSIMNFLPDVEMLREELQENRYNSIKNGTKTISSLAKGISLNNVSFSHKNRETLLSDITMDIKKDKVTALVGPSGSGKSTIINLLLRLYDTNGGSVSVDGIDIKDLELSTYRDHIGYISQEMQQKRQMHIVSSNNYHKHMIPSLAIEECDYQAGNSKGSRLLERSSENQIS